MIVLLIIMKLIEVKNLIKNCQNLQVNMQAVEKSSKIKLKYHRAYRKSTYLNEDGESKKQDSFKFEKFIFDAFNYFDDMLLLRVNSNDEFAPIKKEEDIENAVKLYLNKNKI